MVRLFGNMNIKDNTLFIGDVSTVDIAEKYKTPLYVIDEDLLRDNCRRFYRAFHCEDENNRVTYAGKAFLTVGMCQIINEEKLNLDVVSGGELYTAYRSGFPMDKIFFHGNNKSQAEVDMGIRCGVGRFVVDNYHEIELINETAEKYDKVQKVLLRITPGIEAHTHDYIKTGQIDSKFGFSLLDGNVIKAIKEIINLKNVELSGLHCHIGSQIFELEPYEAAVDVMFSLIKSIKDGLSYEIKELDLGGGFGIYYKEGDSPKPIEDFCSVIINSSKKKAMELDVKMPSLIIEPGRSIVGNTGVTLYTVGAIKEIPEIRKYAAIDGGMTDNIRPALYKAGYECLICSRANSDDKELVTIAGKCCESGDILLNNVLMPDFESGDILAVLSTGAYGYSMSNNYNKFLKPAVVIVKDGQVRIMCQRQTYSDLIMNEVYL